MPCGDETIKSPTSVCVFVCVPVCVVVEVWRTLAFEQTPVRVIMRCVLELLQLQTQETELNITSSLDCSSGRFGEWKGWGTQRERELLYIISSCSWLEPLFCAGARHSLEHSDLYVHPSESDSRHLLDKFNRFVC